MPEDPSNDAERVLRLMPGAEVPEESGGSVVPGSAILKVISDDGMYLKTKAGFIEAGNPPVKVRCSSCALMFYVPASYDPDDSGCEELRCRICGAWQGREGHAETGPPAGLEGRVFEADPGAVPEELPGPTWRVLDDTMYFKTLAGLMEAGDPPVQALCSSCRSMFYVPASYDPNDPDGELRCRICGRVQERKGGG